jgi:hypothetical protein
MWFCSLSVPDTFSPCAMLRLGYYDGWTQAVQGLSRENLAASRLLPMARDGRFTHGFCSPGEGSRVCSQGGTTGHWLQRRSYAVALP